MGWYFNSAPAGCRDYFRRWRAMPRLRHETSRRCRMTEISIEPFTLAHLDGLIALVAAEGWTEHADDVERTRRALTAPGVTTLVAVAGGHLVGALQVQSDGLIRPMFRCF